MTQDLTAGLQDILRPKLRFLGPNESIPLSRNLGELGLDSMASIDLLLDIETELGVSIPDEMITVDTFSTVENLLEVIHKASS